MNNVWLMVPFVRTVSEADMVIAQLAENGITREEWTVIMMCEVRQMPFWRRSFYNALTVSPSAPTI